MNTFTKRLSPSNFSIGVWALLVLASIISLWLALPAFVELQSRSDTISRINADFEANKAETGETPDDQSYQKQQLADIHAADEAVKNLMEYGTPPLIEILSDDTVFDDDFRRKVTETGWPVAIQYLPYNWGVHSAYLPSYVLELVLSWLSGLLGFASTRLASRKSSTLFYLPIELFGAGVKGIVIVFLVLGGVNVAVGLVFHDFQVTNPFSVAILGFLAGSAPTSFFRKLSGGVTFTTRSEH